MADNTREELDLKIKNILTGYFIPEAVIELRKLITLEKKQLLDELIFESNVYDDPNTEKEPFYAIWVSEVQAKRKELQGDK